MRIVETDWWCLQLPEEWRAEQEDESIVIFDCDEVGVIELSTLYCDQESEAIIDELSAEARSCAEKTKTVKVGSLEGEYFQWQEDDTAIREWYLRAEKFILLVTYSCDSENRGMDDAAVDEILNTLIINE